MFKFISALFNGIGSLIMGTMRFILAFLNGANQFAIEMNEESKKLLERQRKDLTDKIANEQDPELKRKYQAILKDLGDSK